MICSCSLSFVTDDSGKSLVLLLEMFRYLSISTPPAAETKAVPTAMGMANDSSVQTESPPVSSAFMSSKHNAVAAQEMIVMARHWSTLILLRSKIVERRAAKTMRRFMMAVKMYDRRCDSACMAMTLDMKYIRAGTSKFLSREMCQRIQTK